LSKTQFSLQKRKKRKKEKKEKKENLSFVENNDLGHQRNKMNQWHYFRKGLHVLLPKFVFFIQMNF
jgi:hypothetical protein